MGSHQRVTIRKFDKKTLTTTDVLAGISPKAMRRVFSGWLLFALVVGGIVAFAPDLSQEFILITVFVLISFTFVIFWQSRITQGWPSIIVTDDAIGVVRDPQMRQFVCVDVKAVKEARPTIIKPNKKAVEIMLEPSLLSDNDIEKLNRAVWPRDDRLIGLTHFKKREDVCDTINRIVAR